MSDADAAFYPKTDSFDSLSPPHSPSLTTLNESENLILENPDGNLYYGSSAKTKKQVDKIGDFYLNRIVNQSEDIVVYVDNDRHTLYSGLYNLPTKVDEFVAVFLRTKRFFLWLMITMVLFEIWLISFAYAETETSVNRLLQYYAYLSRERAEKIYLHAMISEVVFCTIYNWLGFIAIGRKSTRLLIFFCTMSLLGLVFEIFLTYANRFEILLFLFRFFAFLTARFLYQLLLTLLLLPRERNR